MEDRTGGGEVEGAGRGLTDSGGQQRRQGEQVLGSSQAGEPGRRGPEDGATEQAGELTRSEYEECLVRARGLLGRSRGKSPSRRTIAPDGVGERGRPTPEQKLLILDAWQRSKLPATEFGALVCVRASTLYAWRRRFQDDGPAGLADRVRGRPSGSRLPEPTKRAILMMKQAHPEWGQDRLSALLMRTEGYGASPGAIQRVLIEAGYKVEELPTSPHEPKPTRFERTRPNQMWQTDLFTFLLRRENRRVHLVAFMDDHSRFIVGYGLHASASGALVREVLEAAIANFGAPEELLSDNGTQYRTWRGTSAFQKLLAREGIRHVVARSHHPQTVGKCERLWETVNREFWERAHPQDLANARDRLGHFFAHYNFFRPHQGIEGAVPADRFFGAENALRKTLEGRLSQRELDEALSEKPRKSAYLFGQVGEEQVAVWGERGELRVETSSGVRQRMDLDDLGASSKAQKEKQDGSAEQRNGRSSAGDAAPAADGQETAELRPSAALPARSEGAVAERHGGGADQGAPSVHPDPDAVAGEEAARGDRARAVDPAAAGVAAQPAGSFGDAGGPVASAPAAASQPGDDHGEPGRRSADAQEAFGGEGQADRGPAGPDPALDEHPETQERAAVGRGGADEHDENASRPSERQA
jgi:transposase InsO family protein